MAHWDYMALKDKGSICHARWNVNPHASDKIEVRRPCQMVLCGSFKCEAHTASQKSRYSPRQMPKDHAFAYFSLSY